MTRSQRFDPLIRVAQSRERDAAVALANQQRLRDERRARLTELLGYRDDYLRRLQDAGSEGMESGKLQEYRVFLERLESVIEQQRALVTEAERAYEQQRAEWYTLHGRTKSLDKVATRYRDEERRDADRREQSASDERSQYANGSREG